MRNRELLDPEHAMPSRGEMVEEWRSPFPPTPTTITSETRCQVRSSAAPWVSAVAVCCRRIRLPLHLSSRYWRRLRLEEPA